MIIPNYNHAPYLRERIDSVLNQTYPEFEVIILDDKSKDNSKDIIESYRDNPRISHIIFNEENSGCTFKQWQKGFKLAQGEYIWIAESDDVAHKDFIKILMDAIGKYDNVAFGVSKLQYMNEHGVMGQTAGPSKTTCVKCRTGKEFIERSLYFGNHLLNASSVLIRKSSLNELPLQFMNLGASGDYMFYIELCQRGNVVEVPEVLDYFRRHSDSVTPRLYASGVAFKNAFAIYKRLSELGVCHGMKKQLLVGFRLNQIDGNKNFNSPEVEKELHDLWANEITAPALAKLMYRAYMPFKYLKSIIWR